MSRVVWKFALAPAMSLPLPRDAVVVHVHDQDGSPHMWVELDPLAPQFSRPFAVVGTGQDVPSLGFAYVGSAHCGEFVWHVYEGPDS